MSKKRKEYRKCKSCGKLLVDERFSLCRRCTLKRRNKGSIFSGGATGALAAFGFLFKIGAFSKLKQLIGR